MTDLVFDAAGERYYETGVFHAVFFPHTGGAYVWNGLTGVDVNPTGGEPEDFWYDGNLTLQRLKPVKFGATIHSINTPREFDICEGVYQVVPGMKTHFNKRVRFNVMWITKIGNDQDPDLAYKVHIVYNALVQPTPRNFVTVSDTTTPESRSFAITATPCGLTPYYTFDSRDGDLTALLNTINAGTLPTCSGLAALVGVVVPDEEVDCVSVVTDLEGYSPGQTLNEDIEIDETEVFVVGVVNNGLDIVELPVDGAFDNNASAATPTIVGTGDILADASDATYITSLEGDLGYTIKLPTLTGGYVTGCTFQLHIRMSITGLINPDDPGNLDAEAQVHISTDADGLLTVGGFSDGAQEGMAFKLSDVAGIPVDYIIPLQMDAWINTNIDDVVAALEADAYLNILGASNFNPDPAELPVEVRVYEAKIVMLNTTDGESYLRADPVTDIGTIEEHIYTAPGGPTDQEQAFTTYVDFKIKSVPDNAAYTGIEKKIVEFEGNIPGSLTAGLVGIVPTLGWRDEGTVGAADVSVSFEYDTWYRVRVYWTWGTANVKVWARDESVVYLIDRTIVPSSSPTSQVKHYAGMVGG